MRSRGSEKPFLGVDIFCMEPHSIYFTDIKSVFNLENIEPATGHPAPELEVEALKIVKLDVLEQDPGCQNLKMI